MKIYTSYYAKTRALIQNNIIPISVSAITPKYLKGQINYYLSYIAPRYNMLRMSEEKYIPEYTKLLSKLNPEKVIKDIESFTGGEDCALMCYEKPEDFCHRQMIAKWLTENTEYEVKEWKDCIKEVRQTVLF